MKSRRDLWGNGQGKLTPDEEQLYAVPSSDHESACPRNRADELVVRAAQRGT